MITVKRVVSDAIFNKLLQPDPIINQIFIKAPKLVQKKFDWLCFLCLLFCSHGVFVILSWSYIVCHGVTLSLIMPYDKIRFCEYIKLSTRCQISSVYPAALYSLLEKYLHGLTWTFSLFGLVAFWNLLWQPLLQEESLQKRAVTVMAVIYTDSCKKDTCCGGIFGKERINWLPSVISQCWKMSIMSTNQLKAELTGRLRLVKIIYIKNLFVSLIGIVQVEAIIFLLHWT